MGKHLGDPSLRQSPPERHTIVVIASDAAATGMHMPKDRWLFRGQWSRGPGQGSALLDVLDELGAELPAQGLAALRLWGQTGRRPEDWVTAADPVYLEARLDHLRVHTLDDGSLGCDERVELFDFLQAQLGNSGRRFELVDGLGYLHARQGFATASCPAERADPAEPQAALPPPQVAADHDRLVGELQLLLHEAPTNRRREQHDLAPVNSLWFWGGGCATTGADAGLPRLFAGDPQFLGYWLSRGAEIDDWRGGDLPPAMPPAFVAVLPQAAAGTLNRMLQAAKGRLLRGQLARLTLLFSDGWRLKLRRRHLLAVWRRRRWPVRGVEEN